MSARGASTGAAACRASAHAAEQIDGRAGTGAFGKSLPAEGVDDLEDRWLARLGRRRGPRLRLSPGQGVRFGFGGSPVCTSSSGTISRYTVGLLVSKHAAAATAAADCPSLKAKRVTTHTLRHTNAMPLRAKDVDTATIALWLGHESTQTTHIYEHADP